MAFFEGRARWLIEPVSVGLNALQRVMPPMTVRYSDGSDPVAEAAVARTADVAVQFAHQRLVTTRSYWTFLARIRVERRDGTDCRVIDRPNPCASSVTARRYSERAFAAHPHIAHDR
jgi:hypothetical protein